MTTAFKGKKKWLLIIFINEYCDLQALSNNKVSALTVFQWLSLVQIRFNLEFAKCSLKININELLLSSKQVKHTKSAFDLFFYLFSDVQSRLGWNAQR